MGAKDSKRSCLPYEDAWKRMSPDEYKRVCEAFKRLSNGSQLLSKQIFIQQVLGDGVPQTIAEWLFVACGGSQRGIALKDLICGLVLLTKGKQDEKIRFLWTLYSNDSGTHITRAEFSTALQIEGGRGGSPDSRTLTLFPCGQDRITYDFFAAWIERNKDATILSKWLLSNPCVSLSSEVEAPTFYQTLAGVTHLEEQNICELEKCFWTLQTSSPSGQLDLNCVTSMIYPPVPLRACEGLFLALDVNRDGHVDFKELCCGISAACRGPTAERMKFCFKIFDMDRDCYLNRGELEHMKTTLLEVAQSPNVSLLDVLEQQHLDEDGGLSQEEFLVWATSTEHNDLVEPMLELLFQVCHISFVLRPHCRHHEHDIVKGWLQREERRGYSIGQFWFLISNEWWQNWLTYTTSPRTAHDYCNCRPKTQLEDGIVCDESLISNGTNDSNSMESMSGGGATDLSKNDTCSIASSSGVSSSSGTISTKSKSSILPPGPIDNTNLVSTKSIGNAKVQSLTGEGGRLKRDTPLVQNRDFILVPDSLWKALAHWYGGQLPLPRQVIRPPGTNEVELELYPLNLNIYRHQTSNNNNNLALTNNGGMANGSNSWSSVVGGYGAAALNTAGLTTNSLGSPPRRCLMHTAAFSRLANVRQVIEYLCLRLNLRLEDVRLWHIKETTNFLEDENATLQDLQVQDDDKILLEVRNKDLTWPEELGALVCGGMNTLLNTERRPTICLPPGATGLHNLGNTCFMNAALQAVSNTRPLTMYFQRDGQLCELNTMNPLGTRGMVAKRYAELCRELWAGSTRSVAPLKLRYCVTKHAPHLGGGGQQDSQELLAWLLDALHEDLNRVAKKQYTELKDSGGRPDEIVADEAWHQHLQRDHSIITDLFYGQLKSKVTCDTCGHESVRFDPFNLLSLPLPMESFILCEILVVRLDGTVPIKYGMRLNSDAKYWELKQHLAKLCDIRPERVLLAEIATSQIRQVLSDEMRINGMTATELYGYELPDVRMVKIDRVEDIEPDLLLDGDLNVCDSPLARSPEVRGGSALCMPNILCFKKEERIVRKALSVTPSHSPKPTPKNGLIQKQAPSSNSVKYDELKVPTYLVAVHRKCVQQETYFLSQQKSKPSLFGLPLLLGYNQSTTTCQSLYESVFAQVTRLLSPPPQSDQTNHAQDCDDSLRYTFPFTLKAVLQGGQICALCHWTQFCRGCPLPCDSSLLIDHCDNNLQIMNVMCIAIDWDPTALHLRYQSGREKLCSEDESIMKCRKLHTEPIDLDYCLRAFTSEERLEAKYHCSNCQDKQPARKKLQIWRLPPILIIHLKRFDYVNSKWVKTHKVVNFPFKDFDPTAYLASVPQETILRHVQLMHEKKMNNFEEMESSCESVKTIDEVSECSGVGGGGENTSPSSTLSLHDERSKLLQSENGIVVVNYNNNNNVNSNNSGKKVQLNNNSSGNKSRARLESTSLLKTPIIDEHLKDYHQHKLLPGQDRFDLKYQLYAVVSHSGMLNGGHYISYACNPNGNWYCYNDSSCREVMTEVGLDMKMSKKMPSNSPPNDGITPLSRRKAMRTNLKEEQDECDRNECDGESEVCKKLEIDETAIDASLSSINSTSTTSFDASEQQITNKQQQLNYKCPYSDVKSPKIDTSSAYILFYERSGLDYKPYLPNVINNLSSSSTSTINSNGQIVGDVELDENESELRKQLCLIQ